MNTLNFRGPASGEVPEFAAAEAVVVMGKNLGAAAVMDVARNIGTAVEENTARPVNWLNATIRVAPGGGLAPKGGEKPYRYQGGEMFGIVDQPTAKIR